MNTLLITKQIVVSFIAEAIAKNERDIASHNTVAELLKSVEGKEINHRTFSKKRCGDTFKLVFEHSSYYIMHDGNKHQIGNSSHQPYVNSDLFEREFDAPNYQGSIERINKLNALDVDQVVEKFSAVQKALIALVDAVKDVEKGKMESFYNPIYHQLMNTILPEQMTRFTVLRLNSLKYLNL